MATLSATLTAAGALWFTAQSLSATQQTAVTDRFRLAAEQLASNKTDVRLSGIYLLERLAKDSPDDHPTVFAVLSAFLRTHTTASACERVPFGEPVPVDIQAALTVIGRRDIRHDNKDKLALEHTCLTGMNLSEAHFDRVSFDHGDLPSAFMYASSFKESSFFGTNLTDVNLLDADLRDAVLLKTDLTGADLKSANLTRAELIFTDLTRADLTGADLTGANLFGVYYDDTTRWPDGYTPPKSHTPR
ncbi:pentapeptide repeat-containing protein [Nocardia sp. NPDC004573]